MSMYNIWFRDEEIGTYEADDCAAALDEAAKDWQSGAYKSFDEVLRSSLHWTGKSEEIDLTPYVKRQTKCGVMRVSMNVNYRNSVTGATATGAFDAFVTEM